MAAEFIRITLVFGLAWNSSVVTGQEGPAKPKAPSEPLLSLRGTTDEGIGQLNHAIVAPDGKQLISTGPHGTVIVWETATGKETFRIQADTAVPPNKVASLALAPDGKHVASTHKSLVKLWDVTTGREVLRLRIDYPD